MNMLDFVIILIIMKGFFIIMKVYLTGTVYSRTNYDKVCYFRAICNNQIFLFKIFKNLKDGTPNPLFDKVNTFKDGANVIIDVNHYFKDGTERLYLYDCDVVEK